MSSSAPVRSTDESDSEPTPTFPKELEQSVLEALPSDLTLKLSKVRTSCEKLLVRLLDMKTKRQKKEEDPIIYHSAAHLRTMQPIIVSYLQEKSRFNAHWRSARHSFRKALRAFKKPSWADGWEDRPGERTIHRNQQGIWDTLDDTMRRYQQAFERREWKPDHTPLTKDEDLEWQRVCELQSPDADQTWMWRMSWEERGEAADRLRSDLRAELSRRLESTPSSFVKYGDYLNDINQFINTQYRTMQRACKDDESLTFVWVAHGGIGDSKPDKRATPKLLDFPGRKRYDGTE